MTPGVRIRSARAGADGPRPLARRERIVMKGKKPALKVKSQVKAGGIQNQHNRPALKVKSKVKAGGIGFQHNQPLLSR